MGAKRSNKGRVEELEREVKRYRYLAEAKQRELSVRKEEIGHMKDEYRAGLEAAGMHIVVLLSRIGEESVFISKDEIKEAAKTKVYIKAGEDGFTIGIERVTK